jgi:rhodanese-related sulfurtransferase
MAEFSNHLVALDLNRGVSWLGEARAGAAHRDILSVLQPTEPKPKPKELRTHNMKKLLATLASMAIAVTAASAGEFPDISIKELKEAIAAKKVTVIDVNGSSSFANGHIPTAIDFAAKKAELAKLLPKDKEALVVAYCGGPACSAYQAAATAAQELGYKNVKHLSAGISGWVAAGEKTAKPEDEEKKKEATS